MATDDVSLTRRQEDVLAFIESATRENGWPPTFREIAENFGWSSHNAAVNHVNALVKKGYIKQAKGYARGLKVV